MSPRPLCHLVPFNVYEEAWPFIVKAADEYHEGNVSEYIRSLIWKDLMAKEIITEVNIFEWAL